MKHYILTAVTISLSAVSCAGSARAQEAQPYSYQSIPLTTATYQQQATSYTSQQLDQMLAPIALYPDPLIAQILMASTYPLDVVEAYRWIQDPANAGLQAQAMTTALDQQPWDPSVKSLTPFPQVLKTLNDNLSWMEQLGDAFLAQQAAVMDSIQRLRQQAETAGTLSSTPQQVVSTDAGGVLIQPANPNLLYVPDYDPASVYGAWPYADYQPYRFAYSSPAVYQQGAIGFTAGIVIISSLWNWDHWDWHNHRIAIDNGRFTQLNRGRAPVAPGYWRHDPGQRRGVPYHSAATRAQFQNPSANPDNRRAFRGFNPAAHTNAQNITAAPQVAPVPLTASSPPENRAQPRENRQQRRGGVTPNPSATIAPQTQAVEIHTQPTAPFRAQTSPQAQPRHQSQPRTEAPHNAAPPLYESFAHGPDVHAQSVRGSSSRSMAPAPQVPAAPSMPVAPQPHEDHRGSPGGHVPQGNDKDKRP